MHEPTQGAAVAHPIVATACDHAISLVLAMSKCARTFLTVPVLMPCELAIRTRCCRPHSGVKTTRNSETSLTGRAAKAEHLSHKFIGCDSSDVCYVQSRHRVQSCSFAASRRSQKRGKASGRGREIRRRQRDHFLPLFAHAIKFYRVHNVPCGLAKHSSSLYDQIATVLYYPCRII